MTINTKLCTQWHTRRQEWSPTFHKKMIRSKIIAPNDDFSDETFSKILFSNSIDVFWDQTEYVWGLIVWMTNLDNGKSVWKGIYAKPTLYFFDKKKEHG